MVDGQADVEGNVVKVKASSVVGGTISRSRARPSRASSGVHTRFRTWSQQTLVASLSQKSGTKICSSPSASACARWLSRSSRTHFKATLASTTNVTSGARPAGEVLHPALAALLQEFGSGG